MDASFICTRSLVCLLAVRAVAGELAPIDVGGFHNSADHWRNIRDESRVIKAQQNQPSYRSDQVGEIVANILLFQRDNGGWPKDYDMTAILTAEQKATVRATHGEKDTSFDNGNIHSQVSYLAHAFVQSGQPEWRAACERGFDFLLAAQYENGGFPQRHPGAKDFRAHITFNDSVMIGCLTVLNAAASREPQWKWLDDARRKRALDAVRRGVDCILRCQIRVEGKFTGWCQQHDEHTFEARAGRAFELASICPQDTTEIVRFLVRLDSPSETVKERIESACAWLARVPLRGTRIEKVKAPRVEFERHAADFDKVLVPDAKAPPLWARHYEIGTDRPIFAGRDGVKKYAFAEIERERRTGTPWFGDWPRKFLEQEYPRWRERQ